VLEYGDIVFRFQFGKHKFLGFGLTQKWVKWNIFWDLLLLEDQSSLP
jgi:hypothetical protein